MFSEALMKTLISANEAVEMANYQDVDELFDLTNSYSFKGRNRHCDSLILDVFLDMYLNSTPTLPDHTSIPMCRAIFTLRDDLV